MKWFLLYLLIAIGSIVIKMSGMETHGLFATLLNFPIIVFIREVRDFYFILDSMDFKGSSEYVTKKTLYLGKGMESAVLAFNTINYFVNIITINVLITMIGELYYVKLGDKPFDDIFLTVDLGVIAFTFGYLLVRFCWWINEIYSRLFPVKLKLFTIAFILLISHCIYILSVWHWNGKVTLVILTVTMSVTISIMLFGWSHMKEMIEENVEGVLVQRAIEPSGKFIILTSNEQIKEFSCDTCYPVLLYDGSILIRTAKEKQFTIRFNQEEIKSYKFQK